MARFSAELPNDLIKELTSLEANSEKMMGEMTRAGAEVAMKNIKASVPVSDMAKHVKLTKTYKTPTDDGINTKVYISGYIPFSDPKRKYFSRKNKTGKVYKSTEGVPADFLAKVYEYGRSGRRFPKKPFVRKSFKKMQIEEAMFKVQKEYIKE